MRMENDSPEVRELTGKTTGHKATKPWRRSICCDKNIGSMFTDGSYVGHVELVSEYIILANVKQYMHACRPLFESEHKKIIS